MALHLGKGAVFAALRDKHRLLRLLGLLQGLSPLQATLALASVFASASMYHTQGWVSALGSLVLTHGLIGPAVGGTDGFGLSPGAVEVALRVTVAYEEPGARGAVAAS